MGGGIGGLYRTRYLCLMVAQVFPKVKKINLKTAGDLNKCANQIKLPISYNIHMIRDPE